MRKIILLLTMIISPLFSEAAYGCRCIFQPNPTSDEIRAARQKAFDSAAAVFTGEVIELDLFKVKFKVDKIWKGDALDEIVMLTGAKDNGDGTHSSSSCDYGFESGGKYLIYAYGEPHELKTHACSGSRPVANAGEEIQGLDEIKPHGSRNKGDGAVILLRQRNLTTACTRRPFRVPLMHVECGRG